MEGGSKLIEYDLRIKKGDNDDDLQPIDGAATLSELTLLPHVVEQKPYVQLYRRRIAGDYGAVDMTVARLGGGHDASKHIGSPPSQRPVGGFYAMKA
ncbi:hypothetical protein E2562_033838 [Oryza meyeriana var. granulata]|uniref:Uncharacterized protein n=1 Tax=Oryza meyeriana var. granulata TaxID=110450 RepID=A0A6G1BPF7_9ORYZ|nr:hypothetical protein E2562_033838 [Oryza meyeriana var. granulata]